MQDFDQGFAERLREELARRRLSRQALADMARISLSTLEKALSGSRPFTLASAIRIEEALGVSLRGGGAAGEHGELAPDEMGAYARAAVRWIEQDYVTLRPSFGTPGAVTAYRTRIAWDKDAGHLRFAESDRVDGAFAQSGDVSMPYLSGHIYLATNVDGQHRLIILSRVLHDGRMFGLLATLQIGTGSQLMPIACPIAFVPQGQLGDAPMGLVGQDHPAFPMLRTTLDQALRDDFCRWRQ